MENSFSNKVYVWTEPKDLQPNRTSYDRTDAKFEFRTNFCLDKTFTEEINFENFYFLCSRILTSSFNTSSHENLTWTVQPHHKPGFPSLTKFNLGSLGFIFLTPGTLNL